MIKQSDFVCRSGICNDNRETFKDHRLIVVLIPGSKKNNGNKSRGIKNGELNMKSIRRGISKKKWCTRRDLNPKPSDP